MAYKGPAENFDLDFRDLIIPPCATFEDTLILTRKWEPETARSEVEAAQLALGAVYGHFHDGGVPLRELQNQDAVLKYVTELANDRSAFSIVGIEETIAAVAVRYLSGSGDDYQAMNDLIV
jgi:hypothetical protein